MAIDQFAGLESPAGDPFTAPTADNRQTAMAFTTAEVEAERLALADLELY
jgi:hypothetical protein